MAQIDHPIYSLCQGADDNTLLIGGGGGKASTGVPNTFKLCKYEDHKLNLVDTVKQDDMITGIGYRKGDEGLIALGVGENIKILNEKYETLATFDTGMEKFFYRAMQFSDDGNTLLVVDGDNVLRLFSVPDLKQITSYNEDDKIDIRASFVKINDESAIAVATASDIIILVPEKDKEMKEIMKIPLETPFRITIKSIAVKTIDSNSVIYLSGFNAAKKMSVVVKIAKSSDNENLVQVVNQTVPGTINSTTISDKNVIGATASGELIFFTEDLKVARRVKTPHGFPITASAQLAEYTATGGLDNLVILTPNRQRSNLAGFVSAILVLILAAFVHHLYVNRK